MALGKIYSTDLAPLFFPVNTATRKLDTSYAPKHASLVDLVRRYDGDFGREIFQDRYTFVVTVKRRTRL